MPWIVVDEHPYYPSVDYYDTREEAEKEFARVREDKEHTNGLHEDCAIYLAQVEKRVPYKGDY